MYHNFPTQLDKDILNNTILTRADGRIEYLAQGTLNKEVGVYQITTRGSLIIHRTFIPQSDWIRYSNVNGLPEFSNIPILK